MRAVDQGAIIGRAMAVQTIGHRAVTMDSRQDIASVAGLAVAQSGDEGMIFLLMASTKIGIIGGVAGGAGAAKATIDRLVGLLQRTGALRIDMAGAAVVAAPVVDGSNVMAIGSQVTLIMAGGTLGAGGNLAHGDMVDNAMASLVVVVTDHTGGINGTGRAIGDGSNNRGLHGQVIGVGLSGGVIAVAEVTGIASHPAMQGVNVGLRSQGAGATLARDSAVTAVTVRTDAPAPKGDRAHVVDGIAVVPGSTMTDGTVSAADMAARAIDQAEVGGAVAEVAVAFVEAANHVSAARGIMTANTGRCESHIAAGLMVLLDIAGMVVVPIRTMTLNAIDTVAKSTPVDFLFVEGVVGIVTGITDNGATYSHPAQMLAGAIAVVAIGAGQGWSLIKFNLIVLGYVGGSNTNRAMAQFTAARPGAGTTLQDAGDGGVAGIALILMDVGNYFNLGMTACGAGSCFGQGGMSCRLMAGVGRTYGLMAVDTIARAAGGVTIGFAQ